MVLKTVGFWAALASASLMASAQVVPPECIIKKKEFGPGGSNGIAFEYTNANLDTTYTPLSYNLCVDFIDRTIVNFQFTYGNKDGTQKQDTPLVGPPTNLGENCKLDEPIPSRDFESAKVVKDGLQVTGFALYPRDKSAKSLEFEKLETGKSYETQTIDFKDDEDIIGFYGYHTTYSITSLGFIVRSNDCVKEKGGSGTSGTGGKDGTGGNSIFTPTNTTIPDKPDTPKTDDITNNIIPDIPDLPDIDPNAGLDKNLSTLQSWFGDFMNSDQALGSITGMATVFASAIALTSF